jgi:hypothetical protein
VAVTAACAEATPTRRTWLVEGHDRLPPPAREDLGAAGVPAEDLDTIEDALREPPPTGETGAGRDAQPATDGDLASPDQRLPEGNRDLLLCAVARIAAFGSVQGGQCWSVRLGRRVELYSLGTSLLGVSGSVVGVVYADRPAAAQRYAGLGVGTTLLPPFWPFGGGQAGFFTSDEHGQAYLGGVTAGVDLLTAGSQMLGIVDPHAPGAPADGFAWFTGQQAGH